MLDARAIVRKIGNPLQPAVITEFIYWIIFLAFILIKSLYFQFSTGLNNYPIYAGFNLNMLFSSIGVLLFIVSVILLLFNRKRILAVFIINILLTILIVSDILYFRYYYNAITIPVLYTIGYVGNTQESVMSLLKASDLIFAADLPLMIIGLILLQRKTILRFHIIKRAAAFLIIMAIGFASFLIARSGADTGAFAYDNNYVINNLGLFYFHYYDTKRFINYNLLEDRTLSKNEKTDIENFFKNKNGKETTADFKAAAKGKNLIIIQLEAIQAFLINRKMNGKEITPNMNKLIKESMYFDNFYYQIGGGNTSDAEFLDNISLYPLNEGAVYFRFPSNTYHSTANILKDQGYDTYAFHANDPSFWNRSVMYKTLGFEKFVNANDYIQNDQLGWGLSDASFFRQSLDKIDMQKSFYSFFITLSSHHPFSYFENFSFDAGKYNKTLFGNYIKAANYVDYSVGQLISELKKRGVYDNTMLVIYGDHMGLVKDQMYDAADFLKISMSDFDIAKIQKVPSIIHIPGQKTGKKITTTGGQIDLLPTIANLMGFEVPYAMGKDLLNTKKSYAVLRNSSVITDRYIFLKNTGKVYDINNGTELKYEDYKAEIKSYQKELSISDLVLKKNAFKDTINLTIK